MVDIEIPLPEERTWRYRLWEIFPGFVSWSLLLLPAILSVYNPTLFAVYIIAFLLIWFIKSAGLTVRALEGYHMMDRQAKLHWEKLIDDLENGQLSESSSDLPRWHKNNVQRLTERPLCMKPSEIYHMIIIATYNESRDTLEPTIKSVLASKYDTKKIILVLAYEERGGPEVATQAKALISEYGSEVFYAEAIEHPKDIKGEVIGKGGNITYAGRQMKKWLEGKKIDPSRVVVTTLDADNRPHPYYLAALPYTYCSTEDPRYVS